MNFHGVRVYPNGEIKQNNIPVNFFKYGKKDAGTGLPYMGVNLEGKSYLVHRVVALCYVPNPLNLSQVDHINKDIYDNSATNLRWVSHGQNRSNSIRNRIRRDKSKYKGVYAHGPNWRVLIRKDGKCNGFGTYATQEQAAELYNQHIKDFHPLAPLNTFSP